MILLDSCAVLEILWDGPDADVLSTAFSAEQDRDVPIIFPALALLETSAVIAVRHKQGKVSRSASLDEDLDAVASFQVNVLSDDLSPELVRRAARIKADHAASTVDCYLIANSMARGAGIATADREILSFMPKRAKIRKISQRFAVVSWR